MNLRAIWAIYGFEMARTGRTLVQSIVAPVITTALYFVVFGAAMGTRISQIEGVQYGAFIVPGLIMLTLLTQSVTNAAFGIYFPKFIGTIYSIDVLPPAWQTVTLFNPVVYLVSGFRWSFFEIADVHIGVSLGMTALFPVVCLAAIWWIFKTGYRLKT